MGGLLALAGGLGMARGGGGEGEGMRMLLASALYGDMALADILPEVAAAGCVGLDLWGAPHGTQREEVDEMGEEAFGELLAEHGVQLVCSTRYPLGPFGLGPEMPFLKKLGGELLVCASGGAPRQDSGEARAGIEDFLEEMAPHADEAGEHGLVIAIENHSNALLSTPDSIRHWAELNRHPALGVAFAPHHLHGAVDEMPGLIRELGAGNLPFVYLQEFGIGSKEAVAKEIELEQMPGRGSLDYGPILAALVEVGFRGYAVPFMHPTPRGVPVLGTAGEITGLVRGSREHIERCLTEL